MMNELCQKACIFPLAQLAAALAAGILAGQLVNLSPSRLTLGGPALCLLVASFALLKRRSRFAAALVTLGFFFAGATLAAVEKGTVHAGSIRQLIQSGTIRAETPVEVTGVLEREPEVVRDALHLTLRVNRITCNTFKGEASGLITLLMPVSNNQKEEVTRLELVYGARISVMVMLEREDEYRNPGVSSFVEYLDRKNIDATGFVKSPRLIERLENQPVILPLALLYKWRSRLQDGFHSHLLEETAGVLDAALLGNRYNLSQAATEGFREGGTFHVLVISGLHITFLGAGIFFITRRFTKNKKVQFLTSTFVVWGYSLAVGAEASVVRAALMFTVVLFAPLLSRRASSLNALGGVAILLLVWSPSDVLDPSFQLTFVSVLAIVVLAWPLVEKVKAVGSWRPTRETPYPPACAVWLRSFSEGIFWSQRRAIMELELSNHSYRLFKSPIGAALERMHIQGPLRYLFAAIVVTVCVQMVLLPFVIVYFHRLSFASLILNIVVSLLMAAVAVAAVSGLVIAQVSVGLAEPLFRAADLLSWLMVHSVEPFEAVGIESLRLPEYTGWVSGVYVIYYVPLAALVFALRRWQPLQLPKVSLRSRNKHQLKWAVVGYLAVVLLILFHPLSARHDGRLRIDFLDVGQGDAAIITSPDGSTILVDAGGLPGPFRQTRDDDGNVTSDSRSIGETVVSEYLWWRGLDHVDYLVATHADADHIEGLNAVAKNFNAKAVLVARTPSSDQEFAQLSKTLSTENIPLRIVGAGDEIRIGNVSLSVLHPQAHAEADSPWANNDSVVLHMKYGALSFLLTADIESRTEKLLLKKATTLTSDVVKVAHHGSKTSSSSAFISATKARFAVISVGQKSMFGHPNSDVVGRWNASGAQVLTTGKRGTITFATNGTELEVSSFLSEEK